MSYYNANMTGFSNASLNRASEVLIDEFSAGTQDIQMSSVATTREGMRVTASSVWNGLLLSKIGFRLRKFNGSPTGTATILVRDSGDTIVATFGTIDVSTLTSSYAWHEFNGATRTLATNDRICIEYSGGNGSNALGLEYQATGTFDGTNTHRNYWISSWVNDTVADVNIRIYAIQ